MDSKKFIENYRSFLEANSNPKRAAKEKAYLYSDLKHYGVSVWKMRKYSKSHQKELEELEKNKALELVKGLWKLPSHEERSMALTVLCLHKEKLTLKDMDLIEKLMRESKGWAFLDSLIVPIMPSIIEKDKRGYDYLKKWIKDDDFWARRSALLAQLLFFRKGQGGDKNLFFRLAESQFNEGWVDEKYEGKDKERAKFFIRKAIGWVLREISAKNPEDVIRFLKKNKSSMSGLSFREASRKFPKKVQDELRAK